MATDDKYSDNDLILTEDCINKVMSKVNDREIKPKKICHYCEEAVESPKLFCNLVCSRLYEEEKKRNK